ncbi:MAG: hypothetical protein KBA26_14660 [Candidatus Delongbacteria bacterium]|nr:hypothetical protein [Candidatus Delongbacteria bacterium]
MAHQISIFVENKLGCLDKITQILGEHQINIRAVSLASRGEFGVLKLLVNDPDLAYTQLKTSHLIVSKREIMAVLINDQPGELHKLLTLLTSNQINIEDTYGFILEKGKQVVMVLEVEKYPEVQAVLDRHQIKTLTDQEIYSL